MPTKNRRYGKVVAAVVLSALLASSLGIVASVVHRRNMAEAFLKDAAAMKLRMTTLEQVQQLSARYGGHIEPRTCDSHGCAYFLSFDNGWLHRLRLAPYTRFTCTLGVADGTLVYRSVTLATERTSVDFGAFVEEWISYPKGFENFRKPFDVRGTTEGLSGNVRWRVNVNLTADATPEQHRIAYGLNLKCLSRIGGCEDAQQILPSVRWTGASLN